MAGSVQKSYIRDLSVSRLKEFKEFKELVASKDIMGVDTEGFKASDTVDAIIDRLDDKQASRLIDALIERKMPARSREYSSKRAKRVADLLEEIKDEIAEWGFDEL